MPSVPQTCFRLKCWSATSIGVYDVPLSDQQQSPGVRVRNTSTAKAEAATDDMFDDEATFDEATSADAHGCEPSLRRPRSDETSEKKLLKSKQRATVSAASSTVVLDDWDDDVFNVARTLLEMTMTMIALLTKVAWS